MKRKGEFKIVRERNRRRQRVFDGLKEMRASGSAWVTLHIEAHAPGVFFRCRIEPIPESERWPGMDGRPLVVSARGRVRALRVGYRKGDTVQPEWVGSAKILARIVEMHPRQIVTYRG